MTYRCFVIGLDGATFDLILPWVAQGKLPAMAQVFCAGPGANCAAPCRP
ncbi:hypothetical protein [Candidatus Amarolinea dominans]|nr:hypothetical protein [Anaerolineae bacterium]